MFFAAIYCDFVQGRAYEIWLFHMNRW